MTNSEKTIVYCAVNNNASYNFNKALEECVEFSEVIIKLQTKDPNNEKYPDKNEAIKEFGDLFYRGLIALKTIFPEKKLSIITEEINKHIEYKLNKIDEYVKDRKYNHGV